jgi:hypothetical protein
MGHFVVGPRVRKHFLTGALCAFSTFPVFGQTLGETAGRVSDPSGATVPGRVLNLIRVATSASRTAVSNNAGDYRVLSIAPIGSTSASMWRPLTR